MRRRFINYMQYDNKDCGPTCLRMIAKYYGRSYSLQTLREKSFITREGVSLLGISEAAENIGFRTQGVRISFDQLVNDIQLPCILHWNQKHFVVCYDIKKIRKSKLINKSINYKIFLADPSGGLLTYSDEEFLKCWISHITNGLNKGTALILNTTPSFYEQEDEKKKIKMTISYFFRYLLPYKQQLLQLALGMLLIGIIQLIFPFLTQSMVDSGIGKQNLGLITLILIAQFVLYLTQLGIEFIRSWIVLHTSTRISISLISDFLIKLMKLPLGFFDTKMIGDTMQRIEDHNRIQSFLTGTSISVIFSLSNFVIFGIILGYFHPLILFIFTIGNALYVIWVLSFMKYRRELDFKRFSQSSAESSNMVQLITGMQEIKLCNSEKQKRWQWERIQVKLFKISVKGLAIGQYQQSGSTFLNQTTTLFISFIAARSVVSGQMTLGMMMSLSYIVGQLTGPISQFIGFAQSLQDAKMSLERLGDIHNRKDEDDTDNIKLHYLPESKTIHIKNLWFSYDGADRDFALEDINIIIPEKKTTAIVGASGCGKTTLIKMMLGFYPPNKGSIYIDETPLNNIDPHIWRKNVGVVMQDGFIFSDTISGNIAVGEDFIDNDQLLRAVKISNIRDYIEKLPMGYNTQIGMEGKGVSHGQKQRILIARSIYKDPEYLFLDEATNSLDATNEREIMDNLMNFTKNKTVVVVAHRLSTVQNADNIIVMDQGKVVEQGIHDELYEKKGVYYKLVKNQLELKKKAICAL